MFYCYYMYIFITLGNNYVKTERINNLACTSPETQEIVIHSKRNTKMRLSKITYIHLKIIVPENNIIQCSMYIVCFN